MPTEDERTWINTVNRREGYGLTPKRLEDLNRDHQKARDTGDARMMEIIEYCLTDLNFHEESSLMAAGEYGRVEEIVQKMRDDMPEADPSGADGPDSGAAERCPLDCPWGIEYGGNCYVCYNDRPRD